MPLGSNWPTGVTPGASDDVGLVAAVVEEAGAEDAGPGGTVRPTLCVGATAVPEDPTGVGFGDGDDAATAAMTAMATITTPPPMPPMTAMATIPRPPPMPPMSSPRRDRRPPGGPPGWPGPGHCGDGGTGADDPW